MARAFNSRNCQFTRKPRARDRAWQSMRILRRFTMPQLVATAEITIDNARKYCNGLERAGFLRLTTPRNSGVRGGHKTYLLIRDPGPKSPRLRTNGITYDPNHHQTYTGGLPQCQYPSK